MTEPGGDLLATSTGRARAHLRDAAHDPRVRVLIADDTAGVRLLTKLALEADGRFLVVDEAAHGREAVEAATRSTPDLVLLDMGMPLMDGLEALPLIRAASPRSTVVVLSGFAADRLEREALALGAVAYLEKGSSAGDLCDQLADIMRDEGITPVGG